jgi:hypothetical protein
VIAATPWLACCVGIKAVKTLITLAVLLFLTSTAAAQSEGRVFVPVVVASTPGAAGSVWQTDIWVTNTTDQAVIYSISPCTQSAGCDDINTVRAQSTVIRGDVRPTGRWLPMPASGSIELNARIRDLSRNASSAGVELPIVREAHFRADEVNLIGIPRDPLFRITIRIYGLDAANPVTVEQIDQNGQLLRSDQVPLMPPGFGDYQLLTSFAQLGLDAPSQPSTPIRMRIRPTGSGMHIWAIASVTNNNTSEVTLIQPLLKPRA